MSDGIENARSAGGIVLNPEGKVILVNQRGISWSFPKGHVEKGESDLEAAKREIYEESGVNDLELIKDLGEYTRFRIGFDGKDDVSKRKTIKLYLFRTNQTSLKPIDPANPEARWITKNEVTTLLTHEKDKEFFSEIKWSK